MNEQTNEMNKLMGKYVDILLYHLQYQIFQMLLSSSYKQDKKAQGGYMIC